MNNVVSIGNMTVILFVTSSNPTVQSVLQTHIQQDDSYDLTVNAWNQVDLSI